MNIEVTDKQQIIDNLCYTELVYGRINKKLGLTYSKDQIEELIFKLLTETPVKSYVKTGKNYYISNYRHNIRMTINSYNCRIITVDKIV